MSRALQSTSASTRALTSRARRERAPSSRRVDAFIPRAAAGEAAKSTESVLVPGQSSLGRSHSYEDEGSSFDTLEAHKVYFPSSYDYDVRERAVAPARYRVTLPKGYDAKRAKPYPAVVCVPGDAGFGPRDGKVSLTTSATKKKWNDKNEVIVVECAFNAPTWLNDSSSVNHESYFLRVLLPHFLKAHNVGKLALLGYGTGAFGALSMLMRRSTAFDCVVAADAPILGGYKAIDRGWGVEDLMRGASWDSWDEAFPRDEDWHPYDVTRLAREPWVQQQLSSSATRIALVPGNKTVNELSEFSHQLSAAGIPHDVLGGFEQEEIDRQGPWVDSALEWLAARLA